ncbi:MAG: CheR family methyltransferase, partial [Myxococcota bacterium]
LVSREAGLDLARCRSADARGIFESVARELRLPGPQAVVDAAHTPAVLDKILATLLVHETFFHRYRSQLRVLEETILPQLLSSSPRRLRLWSAGCSSGPEAYSLAMIALRARDARGANAEVEVIGTDVSPRAIDVAARGVYPARAVAELPDALLQRYLERDRDHWRVGAELAATVRFEKRNLRDHPPAGRFHVIACRNVLMYLQQGSAERVVAQLASALDPQGVIAVGHGESLRKFDSIVTPDRESTVNLYRLADPAAPRPVRARRVPHPRQSPMARLAAAADGGEGDRRLVLGGVYDAGHDSAVLEALRQALAEAVASGCELEIDADGAESLDGGTALMIARAVRAARGSIVIRAQRAPVRRWAKRYGLPLVPA